jgi:hypothetical protein
MVALPVEEFNFDKFKSGVLHEKLAVATWNYLSVYCLLCRFSVTFPIANVSGSGYLVIMAVTFMYTDYDAMFR